MFRVVHEKINIYYLQQNEKEFLEEIDNQINTICKECQCFSQEDKAHYRENLLDFAKRFRYLSLIEGDEINPENLAKFSFPTQPQKNTKHIEKLNENLKRIKDAIFNSNTFDWLNISTLLKEKTTLDFYSVEKTMKYLFDKNIEEQERKKPQYLERTPCVVNLMEDPNCFHQISYFAGITHKFNYNSSCLIDSKCFFGTNNRKIVCVDYEQSETNSWDYENENVNSWNVKVRLLDNLMGTNYVGYFWENHIDLARLNNDLSFNYLLKKLYHFSHHEPITAACFVPSKTSTAFAVAGSEFKLYMVKENQDPVIHDIENISRSNFNYVSLKYYENALYCGLKGKIAKNVLNPNEWEISPSFCKTIVHDIAFGNERLVASSKDKSALCDQKSIELGPFHTFDFGSINGDITANTLTLASADLISLYDLRKLDEPRRKISIPEDTLTHMRVMQDRILYTGETGRVYQLEIDK